MNDNNAAPLAVSMPTVKLLLRWTELHANFHPALDVQHRPGHVLSFLVRESLDISDASLELWDATLAYVLP